MAGCQSFKNVAMQAADSGATRPCSSTAGKAWRAPTWKSHKERGVKCAAFTEYRNVCISYTDFLTLPSHIARYHAMVSFVFHSVEPFVILHTAPAPRFTKERLSKQLLIFDICSN
jgi:hypothetical protein